MVCYESLSEANQRKYTHVVEKLIKPNKKKKYEFQLPALYTARVAQVKADGKSNPNKTAFKPGANQGKSKGTPARFSRPFRRPTNTWSGQTTRPYQNRFQATRQRGTYSPRGQFRGSFRGQMRGTARPWGNRGGWAPRGTFRTFQRPRGSWNSGPRNFANPKTER